MEEPEQFSEDVMDVITASLCQVITENEQWKTEGVDDRKKRRKRNAKRPKVRKTYNLIPRAIKKREPFFFKWFGSIMSRGWMSIKK